MTLSTLTMDGYFSCPSDTITLYLLPVLYLSHGLHRLILQIDSTGTHQQATDSLDDQFFPIRRFLPPLLINHMRDLFLPFLFDVDKKWEKDEKIGLGVILCFENIMSCNNFMSSQFEHLSLWFVMNLSWIWYLVWFGYSCECHGLDISVNVVYYESDEIALNLHRYVCVFIWMDDGGLDGWRSFNAYCFYWYTTYMHVCWPALVDKSFCHLFKVKIICAWL